MAGAAALAFYLESRANLKYRVAKANEGSSVKLQEQESNKGSLGYGNRKAKNQGIQGKQKSILTVVRQKGKKSLAFKVAYLLLNELWQQLLYLKHSRKYARNIFYFFLSIYAKTDQGRFVYSIMLLELIHKVKALNIVVNIFNENKMALATTLGLVAVIMYIVAFFSLYNFRDSFKHAVALPGPPQVELELESDGLQTPLIFDYDEPPKPATREQLDAHRLLPRPAFFSDNSGVFDDRNVDDSVEFNLYCSTLYQCLLSTLNFGLRSGGGLGDVLSQPTWGEDSFFGRYFFDIFVFIVVNLIMMNVFFGIIIDSFSEKRATHDEIFNEVNFQCFVCGIHKYQLEREKVPWKEHIFVDHNLHSYVAFMLHVKNKEASQCNGVEKYVQRCLRESRIDFFPILRCKRINEGRSFDQTKV